MAEHAHVDETTQPPVDDGSGLVGFAISYPGQGGLKTVLFGGLMLLFAWLILPLFIAGGYFIRMTRAAALGEPEPPEFDDWGGMFFDGLMLALVFVPLGIAYLVGVLVASQLHETLVFLLGMAVSYAAPGMYMNYAVHDEWQAAYDFSTLSTQLTTRPYIFGFLIYFFVFNMIGFFVVVFLGLVSLLTIVGWIIIWPMLYFYWIGIDAALWGRVYRQIEST